MKIKNWAGFLIGATILVTVVRYMATFASSDIGQITGPASDVVTIGLTISGLGMGILDTLGGGLLFNGWRKVMPRNGQKATMRFHILTFCVFGLVISGLVILIPFTVSRVAQESIVEALGGKTSGWLWLWAGMVNAIPYFIVAGVFTGNVMVEGLESEKVSGKLPDQHEIVTRNLPVNWRLVRPTLTDNQLSFLANAEPRDIVREMHKNGVNISPRTASNWHYNARKELNMLVE